MLPENLQSHPVAAAVDRAVGEALLAARLDRGELTLEMAPEGIAAACRFLKEDQQFERLSTLTGADRYPTEPRFEVVYHLHSLARNLRLRLKVRLAGANPEVDSVTPVWRGANWYERETFDLFGIRFRNHPDLRRIMLPDDWVGHPLRKDYQVTGERV
jgi:NADH-quinone oxidoreductase subunit C